jgi:ribokinase
MDSGPRHFPGYAVQVRDTTAAGDTFNGALAVALAEGRSIEEAIPFANAAAAISVTRVGAQASAPSRAEVEGFLAERELK